MSSLMQTLIIFSLDFLTFTFLLLGIYPFYVEKSYSPKKSMTDNKSSSKAFLVATVNFIFFTIAGFNIPFIACISMALFFPAKIFFTNHDKNKKKNEFDNSLGEGLQIVSNSLRAGLTLKDSLKSSLRSAPGPFTAQVEKIIHDINIGIPITEALKKANERIDTPNARLAFGSMIISSRTGGDLPMMLEKIIHTVGQRERIKGKLKALTAQGRMQAILVCSAPPLLFVFMYWYDQSRMELC